MISSHTNSKSIAARLRKRRMQYLDAAIAASPGERLSIADLGGTVSFWEMNLGHLADAGRIERIDLFNLDNGSEEIIRIGKVELRQFTADVTNLTKVANAEYDIAFSNSVIEHVGNLLRQQHFAEEIRRISVRYVMQTPNRCFPLEPHFYVPFFPYLPLGFRSWLHQHFKLGWLAKEPDPLLARIDCDQVRLLIRKELKLLFPEAAIHSERLFGMVKSYVLTGVVDT
jgi:hypothetical protein